MAVAQVRMGFVTNPSIQHSRVYAASPFRPYAGLFQGGRSTATDLLDRQIIRSISSPFSLNDQNVIKAIRRQHGIIDDGSYERSRQIGGAVGAIAGIGVATGLFYKSGVAALAAGPVAMPVSLGLIGLGVIGTIFTSMHAGEVIGAAVGSKEGQIAANRYLTNLGNSLVRRPIGTALKTATMISVPIITSRLGITSPYLMQGITMLAMRGTSWVGDLADDKVFGELSDMDKMSYTDLMSLQGDLADNLSGTTILKAIAASIPNQDNFNELLAKAYGVHEEGFDPLDFNDVREAWNIDAGIYGNMAIDILGEILIDADNLGGAIKRSQEKKLTDPIKKKLKEDPDFKDMQDKQIDRVVKEILKEYQIPKEGMSSEQVKNIIDHNKSIIKKALEPFKVQDFKKGQTPEIILNNLEVELKFSNLEKKIESSFVDMIGDIEGVYTTLVSMAKEAEKNKRDIDPNFALLKDMELGKYNPDNKRMRDLYYSYNTFRHYSDANDFQMQIVSYFTKPFQSVARSKFVRRKLNQVLTKLKNQYDVLKQTTKEVEGALTLEDLQKQKEIYETYQKNTNEYIKKIQDEAIEKKLLEDLQKKNPKFQNFKAIEEELEFLKNKIKEDKKNDIESLEDQERLKIVNKQYLKVREQLLTEWNKTSIGKKLKLINEKYRSLYEALQKLDGYGKEVVYVYYANGTKVRRSIKDEQSYKDAVELMEKFQDRFNKGDVSVEKELEAIKESIDRWEAQQTFKKNNTELIRQYWDIYRFLETYEVQYVILHDAFVRMQIGYNKIKNQKIEKTTPLTGDPIQQEIIEKGRLDGLTEIQIEEQLRYHNESLMKKGKEKELEDYMQNVFPQMIREVAEKLGLPEDLKNKMVDRVLNSKNKIKMHPASSIFSVLKRMDKDNQGNLENEFFNNKPDLFNALNRLFLLKDKKIFYGEEGKSGVGKSFVEVLQSIERNSRGQIKNKLQESYKAATEYLIEEIRRNVKTNKNPSGSLTLDQANYIIENIHTIIQSWAYLAQTNAKHFYDETVRDNEIKEKNEALKREGKEPIKISDTFSSIYFPEDFMSLSRTNMQNFALSFVARNFMGELDLDLIDRKLELINETAKKQIETYSGTNEALIVKEIRDLMNNLRYSKLLYAINSRYNKEGILKDIFAAKDIQLEKFDYSVIDQSLQEIKEVSLAEGEEIIKRFEEEFAFLNEGDMKPYYDEIKKELDLFDRMVKAHESRQQGPDIIDAVKNVLAKSGKDYTKELDNFIKKVYSDLLKRNQRKSDMKAAASGKAFQYKKGQVPVNPMLRYHLQNDILSLTNFTDVKDNRRGSNRTVNDFKIKVTSRNKSDRLWDGAFLGDFMRENEPTAQNIRILTLKSANKMFVNNRGVKVDLVSASQIPIEAMPYNWIDAMYKTYEATEKNEPFLKFFKNQDKNESGEYDSYQRKMVSTPYEIRQAFMKRAEELKSKDVEVKVSMNKNGKLNIGNRIKNLDNLGSIEKDFLIKILENEDIFESINILKNESNSGENKYKFSIKNNGVNESEVMVVRINKNDGNSFDLYLPISSKEVFGDAPNDQRVMETYLIDGQKYLKRNMYENKTQIREIFNTLLTHDLTREHHEYGPLLTNKSIFHTYYGNEPVEGMNEDFSNLMWLDPRRTPMADIVLSGAYYFTDAQLKSLKNNPDAFIERLEKAGFDIQVSQANITFATKKPLVYNEKTKKYEPMSMLNLYAVGYDKTNPGRSGLGVFNMRNSKLYIKEDGSLESPYLQNKIFESEENDWLKERGGFNAVSSLVNMNYTFPKGTKFRGKDFGNNTLYDLLREFGGGATNFEDGMIMSRSAYYKYFGDDRDARDRVLDKRRPVKVVDRNSNKGSITVVDDDILSFYSSHIDMPTNVEILISEHGTAKRGTYSTLYEIQNTRHLLNQENKDTVYIEDGKLDVNYDENLNEQQNKTGYLYLYKMEIGEGKSKATGKYEDITRDSMSVSHEDLQVFASLSYIKDGLGNVIDPKGILFDEIMKVSKTYQPGSYFELSGKQSVTAEQFRWHLPYSNSMIIKNNSQLKHNQISVPIRTLVEMGLGIMVKDKFVPLKTKGFDEVLIMRRPTKGRGSIVYAKIVPSFDPDDNAIGIPSSMTKAPNADFDYDGMQFFTMLGFSGQARAIAQRAFSHHHIKDNKGNRNEATYFNDLDEATQDLYNMYGVDERKYTFNENKETLDFKNAHPKKTPEQLKNYNKYAFDRANYTKQETPRVRDYADVLHDRFYAAATETQTTKPKKIGEVSTDSNSLYNSFLENNKKEINNDLVLKSETYLKLKEQINEKLGGDKGTIRPVKVLSFEHLKNMINESMTQLTVDYNKHGFDWMKNALTEITRILLETEKYVNRLDNNLQMASYIIPKFYSILQLGSAEKEIADPKLMNALIKEIIKDAESKFNKEKLTIEENILDPSRYIEPVKTEGSGESDITQNLLDKRDEELFNRIDELNIEEEDKAQLKENLNAVPEKVEYPQYNFDLTFDLKTHTANDQEINDHLMSKLKYIPADGKNYTNAFDKEKQKMEKFFFNIFKKSLENNESVYIILDNGDKIPLEQIFDFKLGSKNQALDIEGAIRSLNGKKANSVKASFNEVVDLTKVKSIKLYSENAATHMKVNSELSKLYVNFMNSMSQYLNQIGINRRVSVRPDLQNKVIHESGHIKNLLEDMLIGSSKSKRDIKSKTGFILGKLTENGQNKELADHIKKTFKNFHLYETVLQYLGKGKRPNVISELILMEGILNKEITPFRNIINKDQNFVNRLLVETGFLKRGETNDVFRNRYNIQSDDDLYDFLDVVFIIKENISKTKFVKRMQVLNDYKNLEDLMKGIMRLRKNGIKELSNLPVIDKDGNITNQFDPNSLFSENNLGKLYTNDDLIKIEKDEMGNEKVDELIKLHYKISDILYQKTQDSRLRDALNLEVEEISNIKTATRLITARMIRASFTDAYYENNQNNFGILVKDPSINDSMLVIKQNDLNKYNREMAERWYRLHNSFDRTKIDSDISRKNQEQRLNKLAQDVSTLYNLDRTDATRFADSLYEEIQEKKLTNVSNSLLEMMYHVNRIYGAMFPNEMAIGLVEFFKYIEDLKFQKAEIVEIDDNLKIVDTGMAFRNYMNTFEKMESNKHIADLLSEFSQRVSDLDISSSMNRRPEAFAKEIMGRIMYERKTANGVFNKDPNAPTKEQFMKENLKESIENYKREKELKDNNGTSRSKANKVANDIIKPEDITKDKKAQEKIKEKKEAFDNRPKIEKSRKKKVIDTYDISRYYYGEGPDESPIMTHNLFNIYSQISGFYKGIEAIQKDDGITDKQGAIKAKKSMQYRYLKMEIEKLARKTNPDFKFKGATRLHTALIDSYINYLVADYMSKNLDNISKGVSAKGLEPNNTKDMLEQFADPKQRKNFIIFDTENNINEYNTKKFYEISYILFNENGEPEFHQMFFPNELNEETRSWLTKKKEWSNEDILALEKELGGFENNKALIEGLKTIVNLIKEKIVIGQSVLGNETNEGEIDKINALIEDIYLRDLEKEIRKNNEEEREFLGKNLLNQSQNKFKEEIDKVKSEREMREFLNYFKELEKQRISKLLGYSGDVIYQDAYVEYEEKISTLLEVIQVSIEESVVKEKIKLLFDTTDAEADVIYKAYMDNLNMLKEQGVIKEQFPQVTFDEEGGFYRMENVDTDELPYFNIPYDENSRFSEMMFRNNAFNLIRDVLRKTIKISQNNGFEHKITLGQFQSMSRISPEFDQFRNTITPSTPLSIEMKVALEHLSEADINADPYTYLKLYQTARIIYEKETKQALYENTDLIKDHDDLFGPGYIVDEKQLKELIVNNPTMSTSDFKAIVRRYIENRSKKILQIEDKEQNPELKETISRIVLKANLFDFNDLDSDAEIKLLSNMLSLSTEETTIIYENIKKRYLNYQNEENGGLNFNFISGNENPETIPFKEEIAYLFKQQAFRDVIYEQGSSLYVHLKNQDLMYKEYEASQSPSDKSYIDFRDELNDRLRKKTNENETNKNIWDQTKRDLKTKILNAAFSNNWNVLEEYINKHPNLTKEEKVDLFNAFKDKFNKTLKKLKNEGIDHRENKPFYDEKTKRFTDFRPTGKKIKYIKGSENIEIYFLKEAIKYMEEDILNIVYAEKMVTYRNITTDKDGLTVEGEPENMLVSWKDYHMNPREFLFDYKKPLEDDETFNNLKDSLKTTNQHMKQRFNKIERLSSFQYRFIDMVSRFRNPDGSWDVKGLWKEMKDGYIGRNFKITVIKEFTDSEMGNLVQKKFMDENFPPDLQHYIDSDQIKTTRDSSLKIVELTSEEQLAKILDYIDKNPDALIGFTTNYDLININKVNYAGYEMPKSGSMMYNAIVGYQKFMMLLNPGFILRNIMDAIQRNYALVFQNGIIRGPMDFIREGKRTIKMEHTYSKHMDVSTESVLEMKSFYDQVVNDWDNQEGIEFGKAKIRNKIERHIKNLNDYKNNILDETEDAKVIENIDKTLNKLGIIEFELRTKDFTNDQDGLANLTKEYAQEFMRMGFLSNIIAESDKLDFNDTSEENIRQVKDEIYFMNLINGIERSEVMSDRYKSKMRKEFYDAFEGEVETFVTQNFLYKGLDKLYNSKLNYFGMFNDKVERWQRLHGVLLDMRVRGLTKIEAYNQSLRRFFNYGKRSNIEEAATAYFPFASFAIRNLDYSLEMLGNMKYMRMISNIMQGMRAMYNDEEEENEFASPFYKYLMRSNGWLPMSQNSSLKTSRALFEGMEIIDNPFDAGYQKLNPMIQQINNLTYGKDMDIIKALGANNNVFINAFKVGGNIASGQVDSPADIAPSIFFEDTFEKYSPRSTKTIYGDYRNLNRDLFFPDGSRRIPSRNPHTTAKNILYKNWVNARLMAKYRRNGKFR